MHINNIKFPFITLMTCLATGCQTLPPHTAAQPNTEMTEATIKLDNQIDTIGTVVSFLDLSKTHNQTNDKHKQPENHTIYHNENEQENLKQQIEQLKALVKQLEDNKKNTTKPTPSPRPTRTKPNPAPTMIATTTSEKNTPLAPPPENITEVPTLAEIPANTPMANNDVYQQAQTLFQQKRYKKVIDLLKSADSGGDGSPTARKQMYLLLLSHQKLNYCQSVINIGQRLAQQFAGSQEAAEAQFMVGQCQWNIQQRDIAKDTWRQLIASQPHSTAAKRAKTSLKQK